jgi:hypothetical protein
MKSLTCFTLIIMLLVLGGCGGGGGSDSFGGGNSGGGNYYARINYYSVSPTNITNNSTITVSWDIDYNSPVFWVEFHMNSQDTTSALTQHFYYNGGIPGGVRENDSVTCSILTDTNNKLFASCRYGNLDPQSKEIIFTGQGYAIFKACVYDAQLNQQCDKKSIPINVQ